MSGKEEYRVFVGGLSRDTSDTELESTFSRFGKVLHVQVMLDRETGRSRGFGFVTFAEVRSMDSAISELHGTELNGRSMSVNKAQPKIAGDSDYNYGRERDRTPGRSDCFKCGRPGHWAQECTVGEGGGRDVRFSSRSRHVGGARGGRDRYGGGRYSERDRGVDIRDRYSSRDRYGSDRYGSDRYPQNGIGMERGYDRDTARGSDRYGSGGPARYGSDRDSARGSDHYCSDRYPQNEIGMERDYDRDSARGSDRYGSGGPARFEGRYRERSGPYDRPSRGRPSLYGDRH